MKAKWVNTSLQNKTTLFFPKTYRKTTSVLSLPSKAGAYCCNLETEASRRVMWSLCLVSVSRTLRRTSASLSSAACPAHKQTPVTSSKHHTPKHHSQQRSHLRTWEVASSKHSKQGKVRDAHGKSKTSTCNLTCFARTSCQRLCSVCRLLKSALLAKLCAHCSAQAQRVMQNATCNVLLMMLTL